MVPGELIKKALEERDLSQKEFAEAVGVRPSHISEIIKGKRRITISFANKIEDLLGIPSRLLLDLQISCDILKSKEESNIEEVKASNLLKSFDQTINIAALLRGTDFSKRNSIEQLKYLKEYYSIDSPEKLNAQFSKLADSCFRRSVKKGLDERMIATWVVKAKAEALKQKPIGIFNIDSQREVCSKIATILHNNTNTKVALKDCLNNYGIGFCEVSKMDHASIDGYSFIKDAIPYIVITGRYNRIDNLAFTVMHELGHIYMNHTTEESQQINIDTRSFEEEDENQKEIEADKFASNWLISESLWKLAPGVNVLNPYLIQVKYSEWATKRNLNKWIVLGRLSHETGIYKFKSDNTRCVNTQEGGNM
jgi:HTH-type transcriptional regulator/antitoxin HigA